jgi:uncharacterized membrane protein
VSWVLVSCIPPLLWAMNNILDEYLAKSSFTQSGMLQIFFGCSFEIFAALVFVIVSPHVLSVEWQDALMMMGLGIILTLSYIPYIFALHQDNAGNAVPIFQSIPVFAFILGLIFLGESATQVQMLAGLLIIICSLLVGYNFKERMAKPKVVALMLFSSFMMAVFAVGSKAFITDYGWMALTFWAWTGSAVFSLLMVMSVTEWRARSLSILRNERRVLPVVLLECASQAVSVVAWCKAFEIGPSVALVQTISGIQPAFVLLFGLIGSFLSIKIFPRLEINRYLVFKLFLIALIMVGLYFLAL